MGEHGNQNDRRDGAQRQQQAELLADDAEHEVGVGRADVLEPCVRRPGRRRDLREATADIVRVCW